MEQQLDNKVDIIESALWYQYPGILDILLRDHTTQKNIIWATDDYQEKGAGYGSHDQILAELITGPNETTVMPRIRKERSTQSHRVRDMAEVFTPTWVCNQQNNLIDEAWFDRRDVFNVEYLDDDGNHCWRGTEGRVQFAEEPGRGSSHSWQDYVRDLRMEITCGEGPYLASRYDRVSGEPITDLRQRVGLLDRKLRVVSENTTTTRDWIHWAKEALMATYGYEWQGDNLLLTREALFYTVLDYYKEKFGSYPCGRQVQSLQGIAYIISWNIWQMDGLKMVVPYSCEGQTELNLFGEELPLSCPACQRGSYTGHIGIPCLIRDWRKPREKQKIQFQSLLYCTNGK